MENQEEAVNRIYEFATDLMINQDKGPAYVKQALIEQGLNEESAEAVVNNLTQQIQKAKKGKAQKDMALGAVWSIGGLIVTFASMSAASGGDTYVVAWGAVLFGAIQFFRGLYNYSN